MVFGSGVTRCWNCRSIVTYGCVVEHFCNSCKAEMEKRDLEAKQTAERIAKVEFVELWNAY